MNVPVGEQGSLLRAIGSSLIYKKLKPEVCLSRPRPSPFVVGVGRSGTTLLRLMLDAHPDLAIPPETHFVPLAVHKATRRWNPKAAFLAAITDHTMWRDHQIDRGELSKRIAEIKNFTPGAGLRVFYQLYAARFQKGRWGDKTPLYLWHMKMIQDVLPEARFIHIVRDGRDVTLSSKDLWFGPNSVVEGARWWCDWLAEARRQAERLEHYLEIRYEDLLLDTANVLRRVCDFIELDWTDEMLQYHAKSKERLAEMHNDIVEGKNVVATATQRAAIHLLAAEPPSRGRICRWKREMSKADQDSFERIAGEWLREFGYEIGSAT
jgi:hypothetical protein